MTFGVDLGTTYSLIGCGDYLYSGLVSSSVDLQKEEQCERSRVGRSIKSGYKVNMTLGESGKVPIKCSSIILKKLAMIAEEQTNCEVKDLIVSVPAKFSHTQRLAVIEAGKLAGLNVLSVINEPTAAAVYCCMNQPGLYMVYDLGGGTFDVSIVSVDTAGISVICTDGLGHLAGNDFDKVILAKLCKKHNILMKDRTPEATQRVLTDIQEAKEQFQKDGQTKYISLSAFNKDGSYEMTKEDYMDAMKVFQPTIKLCQTLLATLMGIETPKLLFVGGSTACPFLRKWVRSELQLESVYIKEQPDLLVAKGVAKYAYLYDRGYNIVQDVTKQLSIADSDGIASVIIPQDSPLPAQGEILMTNPIACSVLKLDLYQGDDCIASRNEYIGTLEYNYGELREAGTGIVNIYVTVNINGIVLLSCEDPSRGTKQSIQLKVR